MRTIEEAAKEYSDSLQDNEYTIETEASFANGVAFAQRWIPIDEDLPEIVIKSETLSNHQYSEKVIVKDEFGRPHISCMVQFQSNAKTWNCTCKVTHWRPITFI